MRLTGGQMIADYLISEGVEYVFAVPGHGNTALLDAFVDRKGEITSYPRCTSRAPPTWPTATTEPAEDRRRLHVHRAGRHEHAHRGGDRVR